MPPKAFESLRAMRWLNVGAFSFALAALVGVSFSFPRINIIGGEFPLASAVATLIMGPLWAHTLRKHPVAWTESPRRGRAFSLLLALSNGTLAGMIVGVLDASGARDLIIGVGAGGLLGATFGIVFWIPTLLATLPLFGLPTAWARSRAKLGLGGEERGEAVVGLLSALTSLILFALTFTLPHERTPSFVGESFYTDPPLSLLRAFAVAGFVLAGSATFVAQKRDRFRRAFVQQAAEGKIPGYRVDNTERGNVLIRCAPNASAYRDANQDEEIFAIDEAAA